MGGNFKSDADFSPFPLREMPIWTLFLMSQWSSLTTPLTLVNKSRPKNKTQINQYTQIYNAFM